ncbi:hypothetical protein [Bradyrhizobium sp. LTSP849]|uniref:hypothetical protein n=1 Tax=Bradyrhizobium sp. LTSP849 TaxID=1615890 RepID=UPI0012E03567|nr:hypothetical protein [Bradyrhizobium sp. LTSP849]
MKGSMPSRGGRRQYTDTFVERSADGTLKFFGADGRELTFWSPKDPGTVAAADRRATIVVRQPRHIYREPFYLDEQQTKKLLWMLQSQLARKNKGPTAPPEREFDLDDRARRRLEAILGVRFNEIPTQLEITNLDYPPAEPEDHRRRVLLITLPFLTLFAALFIYVLVFTGQGVDIWRSTDGDVWAAIRLSAAMGVLNAVVFGSAVALFCDEASPPRRFGLTKSEFDLLEFAIGLSFVTSLAASFAFALLLPEDVLTLAAAGLTIVIAAALIVSFSLATVLVAVALRRRFVAGITGVVLLSAIGIAPAEFGEWFGSALILSLGLSGWFLLVVELARWVRISGIRLRMIFLPCVGVLVLSELSGCVISWPPHDMIRGAQHFVPQRDFGKTLLESVAQQKSQTPTIIIVAAAGGGIRASYWTSKVLARIVDRAPSARTKLFLASGVSGGSVGLSLFRALLTSPNHCAAAGELGRLEACAAKFHEQDFLAGIIGAMVTRDVLNFLIPVFPARSVALEQTWEARWRSLEASTGETSNPFSAPFRALWRDQPTALSLVLNTTSVFGGDRLPISNLHTDGWLETRNSCNLNIAEHIDMPLSTAANNSARFPFVEEWGWFRPTATPQDKNVKTASSVTNGCKAYEGVADGGFYDNFGAATALEAYKKAKAVASQNNLKLRVIVIQVTSDANCETAAAIDGRTERVAECNEVLSDRRKLLAPIWRFGFHAWDAEYRRDYAHNTRLGLHRFLYPLPKENLTPGTLEVELQARSISGLGVARQLRESLAPSDSYYQFSIAGAIDAPLGWALSKYSRDRIDERLQTASNQAEMNRLLADLAR